MQESKESRDAIEQLSPQLVRLGAWIAAHNLRAFASLLLDLLEPVAPIGAQLLYIGQPTFGFLIRHDTIGAWAQLLEDPAGWQHLRHQLIETDTLHGE